MHGHCHFEAQVEAEILQQIMDKKQATKHRYAKNRIQENNSTSIHLLELMLMSSKISSFKRVQMLSVVVHIYNAVDSLMIP